LHLFVHDPPEVHEVTGVVGLPVDGAVLHNVVDVIVERSILHQLKEGEGASKSLNNDGRVVYNFYAVVGALILLMSRTILYHL